MMKPDPLVLGTQIEGGRSNHVQLTMIAIIITDEMWESGQVIRSLGQGFTEQAQVL